MHFDIAKISRCSKIPQNEQCNLKSTKIPAKSKMSSVFWLSLWVFWSFSEVSRGFFFFFLRFQCYFGNFQSFHLLGAFLVIFLGFRIFWTFVVYFSHFGSSKEVIFEIFVYLSDFDILVNLTGKINFFEQKNTLEITRMTIILPES